MLIKTIKLWDDREDVELTTFVTQKDPYLPMQSTCPAVIVCPGGAYATCGRHGGEGDPIAMAFAMDGYQAFVLEYSVTERVSEGKTVYPAMLLDYGKAIMVIREHAEEWNVDVEKISIIGFSAGGHLCGTIATKWNNGILSEKFGVPAEYFKPLCAMLIYPVTDFMIQKEMRNQRGTEDGSTINMDIAYFGKKENDEETLKSGSPAYNVTSNCPPVFLAAAQNDKLVSSENSLHMAYTLQKAGVPYELHIFQYSDHGFALGRNLLEPWRADKAYSAAAWLPMAKTFLLRQHNPETAQFEADPFGQTGALF